MHWHVTIDVMDVTMSVLSVMKEVLCVLTGQCTLSLVVQLSLIRKLSGVIMDVFVLVAGLRLSLCSDMQSLT